MNKNFKHPPRRNKFELQDLNVEEGPQSLANPIRYLRPLPIFKPTPTIHDLIGHPNREQIIHEIAFPQAMNS